QHVIARWEIDVVACVTPAGGAHIFRVERILERKDDAIHRHLLEIGMTSIRCIELGGTLKRVGKPAKLLTYGRGTGGKRSLGHTSVEVSSAGDGTLAPDIQGGERIHLPGMRYADDHPELLLHGRIRGLRLHAAVFEGRP